MKNNLENSKIKEMSIDEISLLLEELISSEREKFVDADLEYLGMSLVDIKRLYAYNVIEKIDDYRFKIKNNIENMKERNLEIEEKIYKECYKELFYQNDYFAQKEILLKYIEVAEKLGINGNYYYELNKLNNIINVKNMNGSIKRAYELSSQIFNLSRNRCYKEAIEKGEIFFEEFKGTPQSYLILGTVYNNIHDNVDALKYLTIAKELDPLNPYVYKQLGYVYKSTSRYEEAATNYKKYIKLDKDIHIDGYTNLFGVYLKQDKLDRAMDLFNDMELKLDYEKFQCFVSICKKISASRIIELREIMSDNIVSERYRKKVNEKIDEIEWIVDKNTDLTEKEYHKIVSENNSKKKQEKILSNLLKPDCNNVVSLKKIDNYISNLQVSTDDLNIIILQAALVLQKNNYSDKSKEYVKIVEKSPNKSMKVKQEIEKTVKELRLLRKGEY